MEGVILPLSMCGTESRFLSLALWLALQQPFHFYLIFLQEQGKYILNIFYIAFAKTSHSRNPIISHVKILVKSCFLNYKSHLFFCCYSLLSNNTAVYHTHKICQILRDSNLQTKSLSPISLTSTEHYKRLAKS